MDCSVDVSLFSWKVITSVLLLKMVFKLDWDSNFKVALFHWRSTRSHFLILKNNIKNIGSWMLLFLDSFCVPPPPFIYTCTFVYNHLLCSCYSLSFKLFNSSPLIFPLYSPCWFKEMNFSFCRSSAGTVLIQLEHHYCGVRMLRWPHCIWKIEELKSIQQLKFWRKKSWCYLVHFFTKGSVCHISEVSCEEKNHD